MVKSYESENLISFYNYSNYFTLLQNDLMKLSIFKSQISKESNVNMLIGFTI